jgi:hypothetical protein
MVTSLKDGTFLTGRCKTSLNCVAVDKIMEMSSGDRSLMPNKCLVDSCIKRQS